MTQKISTAPCEHNAQHEGFAERYISMADACQMFPNGRVSRASLERWWRTGVRGAVLQTYVIGYRRYTTLSAIRKFIDDQQVRQVEKPETIILASKREMAISAAEDRVWQQIK